MLNMNLSSGFTSILVEIYSMSLEKITQWRFLVLINSNVMAQSFHHFYTDQIYQACNDIEIVVTDIRKFLQQQTIHHRNG